MLLNALEDQYYFFFDALEDIKDVSKRQNETNTVILTLS